MYRYLHTTKFVITPIKISQGARIFLLTHPVQALDADAHQDVRSRHADIKNSSYVLTALKITALNSIPAMSY